MHKCIFLRFTESDSFLSLNKKLVGVLKKSVKPDYLLFPNFEFVHLQNSYLRKRKFS